MADLKPGNTGNAKERFISAKINERIKYNLQNAKGKVSKSLSTTLLPLQVAGTEISDRTKPHNPPVLVQRFG